MDGSDVERIEHTNFFETRSTEYSKASTRGTWEEAFS
jgi:ribonucleoside-diphosphate reductase beta chain